MKIMKRITDTSAWISGILIACITVLMIVEVIMRNAFNSPILGCSEFCIFMYVSAVYFGFCYTQQKKGHITVDLLYDTLKPGGKKFCDSLSGVLSTALFAFFAGCNWKNFLISFAKREIYRGGRNMPIYILKLAIAIGGTLLFLQFVLDMITTFRRAGKEKKEAEE